MDLLCSEPVEDGYSHPAEQLIEEAQISNSKEVAGWLYSVYREQDEKNPSLAADLLRCISQLPDLSDTTWAVHMAADALSSPEVQLREAAIRIIETWGGQNSVHYLKQYLPNEQVTWLADYARDVASDLST